ncbi:MAG: hypothetical protein K9L31_02435, partial [Candidatus Pacebacteria bacterium]|nr:hypothetical protein [Candidatus Paceibacterota bacterium]
IDTASKEVKIRDLQVQIDAASRGIKLAENLKDQGRVDSLLLRRRELELTLDGLRGALDFTSKPVELVDDATAMRLEEAGRQDL